MQGVIGLRLLGVLLLIHLVLGAGLGCQSSGDNQRDIQISWEVEPNPPQVGAATINLALQDSTDRPVEGAQVTLEGNMSHPGMQPVIARATEEQAGTYSAEMDITMAGDWFIIVTSTLEDSTVVEHQIHLPGVRPE